MARDIGMCPNCGAEEFSHAIVASRVGIDRWLETATCDRCEVLVRREAVAGEAGPWRVETAELVPPLA